MRKRRRIMGNLINSFFLLLILGGCNFTVYLPQGYALVYGVADYELQEVTSLNYTDDDARDIADLLDRKGWEVRLRIDDGSEDSSPGGMRVKNTAPASLDQLKKDITDLAAAAPKGSRFLFYFAGHGNQASGKAGEEPNGGDANQEWLFFYGENPLELSSSGITSRELSWNASWEDVALQDDQLGTLLGRLPEGMRMVVIDACNSGGFIGTSSSVDPHPQDYTGGGGNYQLSSAIEAYLNYSDGGGADILSREALVAAAAGEREESLEDHPLRQETSQAPKFEHGLFTYGFLEAVSQGDANNDGWITLGEAADYAAEVVKNFQNNFLASESYFLPRLSGSGVDYILFSAD